MAITIAGQTWIFLGGILVGAALGVCYDLFRVVRLAVPHPAALVAVEDLVFFCVCAAGTFLYLLGRAMASCGGSSWWGNWWGFCSTIAPWGRLPSGCLGWCWRGWGGFCGCCGG